MWTAWFMNSFIHLLSKYLLVPKYQCLFRELGLKGRNKPSGKELSQVAFNLEHYGTWKSGLRKILVHFVVVV